MLSFPLIVKYVIFFIVFGLTRSGSEPTIYHTRSEHAHHYIIDVITEFGTCIYRYMYIIIAGYIVNQYSF
jgi:hypothetical protein